MSPSHRATRGAEPSESAGPRRAGVPSPGLGRSESYSAASASSIARSSRPASFSGALFGGLSEEQAPAAKPSVVLTPCAPRLCPNSSARHPQDQANSLGRDRAAFGIGEAVVAATGVVGVATARPIAPRSPSGNEPNVRRSSGSTSVNEWSSRPRTVDPADRGVLGRERAASLLPPRKPSIHAAFAAGSDPIDSARQSCCRFGFRDRAAVPQQPHESPTKNAVDILPPARREKRRLPAAHHLEVVACHHSFVRRPRGRAARVALSSSTPVTAPANPAEIRTGCR